MMNYRGDTFIRNYSAENDGSTYTFENGDTLKVAIIDKSGNVCIEKEIQLTAGDRDVDVVFTAQEMANLEVYSYETEYTVEAELTTSNWTKTVQEKVLIGLDYIVGE